MSLPSPATDFIRNYLLEIRDLMICIFDISVSEAEGRITRDFGSWDLLDEDTENYLGHEFPEYWAKSIYFGVGVPWWLEGEDPEPRRWP